MPEKYSHVITSYSIHYTKLYDTIFGNVLLLQVLQEPSPLANELQQAAPGMMILLMNLEVLGQIFNSVT